MQTVAVYEHDGTDWLSTEKTDNEDEGRWFRPTGDGRYYERCGDGSTWWKDGQGNLVDIDPRLW